MEVSCGGRWTLKMSGRRHGGSKRDLTIRWYIPFRRQTRRQSCPSMQAQPASLHLSSRRRLVPVFICHPAKVLPHRVRRPSDPTLRMPDLCKPKLSSRRCIIQLGVVGTRSRLHQSLSRQTTAPLVMPPRTVLRIVRTLCCPTSDDWYVSSFAYSTTSTGC